MEAEKIRLYWNGVFLMKVKYEKSIVKLIRSEAIVLFVQKEEDEGKDSSVEVDLMKKPFNLFLRFFILNSSSSFSFLV